MNRFYPACRAVLQVVLDSFSDDDLDEIVVTVMPKKATIHRNSYRQADTYELVLDAGDLPFDPQFIRTGFAQIHLYQASSSDERLSVLSKRNPLSDADQRATTPRSPTDTIALDVGAAASRDHFTYDNKPMVAGLFDRAAMELSSDGKWITLNGQDLTAHLASLQWKPNPNGTARLIPVGQRLDELVLDLLEEADPTGRINLDVRGLDPDSLPIVGASEVRGSRRGIPVDQSTSFWDVIYKIVTRYGYIAFVDGVDVVISQPKLITDKSSVGMKFLAWGRNLEHLTLERDLGKTQAPTIVVQSYDEVTRQTISVEYPPNEIDKSPVVHKATTKVRGTETRAKTTEHHKAKASTKKGKTTTTLRRRDEYQVVTLHGISDRKVLAQVAETTYHLVGRGERRIVAKTRDLRDMRESSMLSLSAGDAVMITWDEFNSELLRNPDLTEAEKVDHLVSRGFNPDVAQTIARRFEHLAGLQRPLRVKEATYEFDVDNGIEIELDLNDFIVIDGIRAPEAGRRGFTGRRADRLVKHDGEPIGWTPDERDAKKRQYRP